MNAEKNETRHEVIASGECEASEYLSTGVWRREFVSERCGARGLSAGTLTFASGARVPLHEHSGNRALTILDGQAVVVVMEREYRLSGLDCIYVPSGLSHEIRNASARDALVLHWAAATARPETIIPTSKEVPERSETPRREFVTRVRGAGNYKAAPGTEFVDLFARHLGSEAICGGYGRFWPGASLPHHLHAYDESITIVEGCATCVVEERRYQLSNYDTAMIPKGLAHHFENEMDRPMAMIWVYAGPEPRRTVVGTGRE